MIEPARRSFSGHSLFCHDEKKLLFGYTTGLFTSHHLKEAFFPLPLLFLKQVHSTRIVTAADWRPAVQGDGLLLERHGVMAVIQTADCLPLFFFNDERSCGGVIHVGWRGLQQGIEENLAVMLGNSFKNFTFFLGPAIEKNCYEVGEELPDLFAKKAYAEKIFSRSRPGKYRLDLKTGLKLSLRALGASAARIIDSGLCTYCSAGLFPSYRRDGATGKRIFNFLVLK